MRFLVWSDAALSRILAVSRAAIQHAERGGKIRRCADGAWDVIETVRCWRHNTWGPLQPPHRAGAFRPWLDCCLPLRSSILDELRRRAVAEGAERVDDDPPAGEDADEEDLVLAEE